MPVEKKIIESCHRWFGHVRIRPLKDLVRKVDKMEDSPRVKDRD